MQTFIENTKPLKESGFSLLELMVVVAIIAILALMAIPSQTGRVTQKKIVETLDLVEAYKANVNAFYQISGGDFPDNNLEAGMPDPDKIKGTYLRKLEVREGALHLTLGQNLPNSLHNKIISLRPVFVEDTPQTPLSWVCAAARVPDGMRVAGTDLSDLDIAFLPGRCR